MANYLVVGEVDKGNLKKASKEAVSTAKKIFGSASAVLIGEGASSVAAELGKYGADTIYAGDVNEYNGEAYAKAIAQLVKDKGFDVILIPHSWVGRDISARLGALLDAAVISDAVEIKLEGDRVVIKKPVYSGKAFAELKCRTPIQIVTFRPNSQGIEEQAGSGNVENINVDFGGVKTKLISVKESGGERVPLTEADIVVSAGRGIKGPENMKLIEDLADLLGAGVGASRAVVDAGWCDHTLQIGQTGQTVSPTLYIAVGISGAIQHLAGMGSSKYIVAINKDPDAPIFKVSTYGVVDDLFKVVPAMQEEIRKLKG
ncbi:MAG: electron transfer flavoprotein subunit alpha/FixB family protein [Candidatus Hydrogenedentota bacterium]|nr:MAG: electron transfer flavoprotein subunit alpha/FixB family protein [Candidatus Hydrogenedentota bacterium]